MKNTLRMLGVVACLFVVWMVARGSNGCGFAELPERDGSATLYIDGDASKDPEQSGAVVYGSGKIKQLDANGDAEITVKWYKSLDGESLEGMLTIVSTKGNSGHKKNPKHIHQYYTVTDKGSDTIDITEQELKH